MPLLVWGEHDEADIIIRVESRAHVVKSVLDSVHSMSGVVPDTGGLMGASSALIVKQIGRAHV